MTDHEKNSGLDHILMSNHRGRGHEPVTVLGSIRSLVMVKAIIRPLREK